jgi:hypothetical protein
LSDCLYVGTALYSGGAKPPAAEMKIKAIKAPGGISAMQHSDYDLRLGTLEWKL